MNYILKNIMTVTIVKYLIKLFLIISLSLGQWQIGTAQFSQSSCSGGGIKYCSLTGEPVVSLCSCFSLFLSALINWCLIYHTCFIHPHRLTKKEKKKKKKETKPKICPRKYK